MRICLIGATHVSHNPRLIREADSLSEEGNDVRVVAPSFIRDFGEGDARHFQHRRWRYKLVDYKPVGFRGRLRSVLVRGRRRIACELFYKTKRSRFVEAGFTPALKELMEAACEEPADWFIAHAHAALPVAAAAAGLWNARLGFDCEDLLSENDPHTREQVLWIERTYIERCDYVSVPSESLGERLSTDYRIKKTVLLRNVFPLGLAKGLEPPSVRLRNSKLRLHWFGKTIGAGRGLEEAVEACGQVKSHVELHLRGRWAIGYETILRDLSARSEVHLFAHPLMDHDELIGSLGRFDVGLALERADHGNYSVALTNKIGSYALGGLAIAATDTKGNREFFSRWPEAGFMYPCGKPEVLAKGLERWVHRQDDLVSSQQSSWNAARAGFSWDAEKANLLDVLNPSLVIRFAQNVRQTSGASDQVA